MRPSTEVVCVVCNKSFFKENRMITKTIERKGVHCCSRDCSANYVVSVAKQKSNPFNYYLIGIRKRNAKVFKDAEIITADYLERLWNSQAGLCAITGLPMVHNKQRQEKSILQASVDRIDNTLGYIKGNIRFTTLGANYMRNTFSLDEVDEFLQKIRSLG